MLKDIGQKVRIHNQIQLDSSTITAIDTGWEFRSVGEDHWYPASVPGTNFTDLLENKLIPDPFDRANETDLQWIESRNWEYRTTFFLDEFSPLQKGELIFEGLDTYADVYLNNTLILEASNMFVTWKCDVSDLLKIGENELHILFRSPTSEIREKAEATGMTYPAENDHSEDNLSVYIRKAPYHFGWDWGPRFVTSGVWRPICLNIYDQASIEDVYVKQYLVPKSATLVFEVEVNSHVDTHGVLEITCLNDDLDHQGVSHTLTKGPNIIHHHIVIEDYKKWWPRGLGDPFLYHFRMDLVVDEKVVSTAHRKIGLRTIETVIGKDDIGQSFFFKVNGVPVYAKGANYIPQDSFLTRVSNEKMETMFENAIAANMNMLRVWGGGIYEENSFYNLADEHGILIWQDFMFACTMYPGDQEFLESVEQEASCNIKRLRNHASIIMWCGNNEIEMGWNHWGWQEKFRYEEAENEKLKQDYHILFEELLPKLIRELDPGRYYLPSSPMNNWDDPEKFKYGDHHYWGVWHGEAPFEDFKKSVPRFMSEFGFQSFPVQSSVKKYSLPEDWSTNSEVMRIHQKHPRGNQLIYKYLTQSYHEPKNFESFLYLSQVVQAEGMRVGIEAQRRSKPFCMGTLYWQMNDCWPVASWSGIDYYGKWKALHYEVSRQFRDYLITCDIDDEGTVSTFVVSDKIKNEAGTIELLIKDFYGEELFRESKLIVVKSGISEQHHVIKLDDYAHLDSDRIFLEARLKVNEETSSNLYYFHPPKQLDLPDPEFEYKIEKDSGLWVVILSSTVLIKSVYLEFEDLEGNFSDNFFDLLPGAEKQVSFPRAENSTDQPKLKVMSIRDTY